MILLGILAVYGGFLAFNNYIYNEKNKTPDTVQPSAEGTEPPVFFWRFEQADTLNLDGIPNTKVFLEATYSNGKVQGRLIDTNPGGCNELPDSEPDSLSGTKDVQCYVAGLGQRYKITKGVQSYEVKRKTFEEALPDYNPPAYEYDLVAEFPL